jgi:acyl-CoA thioesterase I
MKGIGSLPIVTELKHFQAKWVPVRGPEMRRNKKSRAPRSYGKEAAWVHSLRAGALSLIFGLALIMGILPGMAADRPVKIVALGDSLTAGYGLDRQSAFPEQLAKMLKGKGIAVEIENAGVSGDTASGGLSRLDWSVGEGTDAVILELGANDMLRGIDPKVTRHALETIIEQLKARNIEVLLAGMRAAPNMGEDYLRGFDPIYPELAAKYGLVYYPFFLDGIATQAKFALQDGMHPNAAGVSQIVTGIMPKVEELIGRVRTKRGS